MAAVADLITSTPLRAGAGFARSAGYLRRRRGTLWIVADPRLDSFAGATQTRRNAELRVLRSQEGRIEFRHMNTAVRLLPSIAGLATLCLATQAAAIGTTYGATYSGVVGGGTDALGLFGQSGADLTGASFSEQFIIDTTAGVTSSGAQQADEIQGADPAAFITSSITINGKTVSFKSTLQGEAYVNDGGNINNKNGITYTKYFTGSDGYHTVYDYAQDDAFGPNNRMSAILASYATNDNPNFSGFPTGLDQSFLVSSSGGGTTYGGLFQVDNAMGTLVENLELEPSVAAAPEPGAWALMMFGIFGLGAALRLRRREAGHVVAA